MARTYDDMVRDAFLSGWRAATESDTDAWTEYLTWREKWLPIPEETPA
jgi:hypothetical protein